VVSTQLSPAFIGFYSYSIYLTEYITIGFTAKDYGFIRCELIEDIRTTFSHLR